MTNSRLSQKNNNNKLAKTAQPICVRVKHSCSTFKTHILMHSFVIIRMYILSGPIAYSFNQLQRQLICNKLLFIRNTRGKRQRKRRTIQEHRSYLNWSCIFLKLNGCGDISEIVKQSVEPVLERTVAGMYTLSHDIHPLRRHDARRPGRDHTRLVLPK